MWTDLGARHERSSKTRVAATSWNSDNGHWLIIINRFGFRPGYLTPADSCAPRRPSPICSETQNYKIIFILCTHACSAVLFVCLLFIIILLYVSYDRPASEDITRGGRADSERRFSNVLTETSGI